MSTQKTVMVGEVPFGGDNPIAFIMGPCQLENRDHAMMMAERVANACVPTGSNLSLKPATIRRTDPRSHRRAALAWTKACAFWPRCATPLLSRHHRRS